MYPLTTDRKPLPFQSLLFCTNGCYWNKVANIEIDHAMYDSAERLEAEVSEASKTFTPVRFILAPAPLRAIKRPRKDTGTGNIFKYLK